MDGQSEFCTVWELLCGNLPHRSLANLHAQHIRETDWRHLLSIFLSGAQKGASSLPCVGMQGGRRNTGSTSLPMQAAQRVENQTRFKFPKWEVAAGLQLSPMLPPSHWLRLLAQHSGTHPGSLQTLGRNPGRQVPPLSEAPPQTGRAPAPLLRIPVPGISLRVPSTHSSPAGPQPSLTLVRICPEVDTLRISFWGPSCSASLSDESSPGPAAVGETAPAPAAAPAATPGGWCWLPAPAILSGSCRGYNSAPRGCGQLLGSARASKPRA